MGRAVLLALLLAVPAQEAGVEKEVRALVAQLDAEDPAQREQARDELRKKGPGIAPLLRKFTSGVSSETAAQVRSILERFEWDALLERSLPPLRTVTLPRGPATPEKVFEEIRRQTGLAVAPFSMNLRAKVEAGWEGAPVLKVLDDLCRALGRGSPEPPVLVRAGSDDEFDFGDRRAASTAAESLVVDGAKEPPRAVAHWRQFRAAVTDVVVTEQRSLKESSPPQAQVNLTVGCQPGIRPVFVGMCELEEAVDDRGQSLLLEGAPLRAARFRGESAPDTGEDPNAVWFEADRWSRYGGVSPVSIKPPSPGARRLARLRLKVRVSFAVREVVRTLDLKDVKGRTAVELGSAVITVTRAETRDGQFHLDTETAGNFRGSPTFALLDRDGSAVPTGGGGSSGSGSRMSRHYYLRGGGEVAAIRTTAWIGHKTFDIPFELADVPLPPEE
jgi:hypothetical protein